MHTDAYTSCARDEPRVNTRKMYSLLEALHDFTKTKFEIKMNGLNSWWQITHYQKRQYGQTVLMPVGRNNASTWETLAIFHYKGVWPPLAFNRASNLLTMDSYDIWTVFSWMSEHLPISVEMLVEGICFSLSSSKLPTLVCIQYSSQVTCLARTDVEIHFGANCPGSIILILYFLHFDIGVCD